MKKELSDAMSTVSRKYSQLTGLRAGVAAIPWVGGAIDVLISERAAKINQARIDGLLEALHHEMAQISEDKIDHVFLQSDDFYDIAVKVFDSSTRTRSETKRRLYARLLASRVSQQAIDTSTVEDYLGIVTELAEKEIVIAKQLYEQLTAEPKSSPEKGHSWASKQGLEKMRSMNRVPDADYDFILLRLQRVGLLKEVTGAFVGYTGGDYTMTDAFRGLMQSLETGTTG